MNGKIVLKPLEPSEFADIMEWVNAHDADFLIQWAGLTYTYPLTLKQMRDHYREGMNSLASGVFVYKIQADTETLGTVQIGRIDLKTKEGYISRFMLKSEKYRGRGIGQAALREAVRIGFSELDLARLKLNVFEHNERAIRCYEAAGFRWGKITNNVYTSSKGETWNNIEMVLEKERWLAQ